MTTIPTITEEDVRDLVGEGSFQRGQRYFRDNRIFDTRRAGMTLKAKCEGSRSTPYRVEVTFDNTGIADTDCSCPVSGYCKHVVALLLTWLAEPDEFIEQQDINTLLQQCEKDELITLIKQMLRSDPDLEYLLTTISKPGTPIDPQIYRNQVEMAYRNAGDEWGAASEIADELLTIKETGDNFAERHDYASAVVVYDTIVTAVIDHHYEYQHQDEEGEIDEVITECVDGLKQCLDAAQGDSALREQILRMLFAIDCFNVEAGGIGFGEDAPEILLEDTTDEERHTIAGWVREAIAENKQQAPNFDFNSRWLDGFSFEEESVYTKNFALALLGGYLLELEEDTLDDEAYLRICRETGRIADAVVRLLELGRIDEAVQETKQASDYDLLGIANLFVEARKNTVAERIMQQRAWRSRDSRLLEWLKKHYKTPDGTEDKLVQATATFQKDPTFEEYKEVRLLATQCGRWDKIRPELRAFLKASHLNELLTQVDLDENDADEIIKIVQSVGSPIVNETSNRIVAIVQAAEETQPDTSLNFYLRYVAYLIDSRNRNAYEQASRILIRMRTLYEKLGKHEAWARYITRLHEQNRARKALQSVLATAGL
jgi:uncharacterized Zn finger protein